MLFLAGRPPNVFVIPSTTWLSPERPSLLVSRDYEGKTSKPEWGLKLSVRSVSSLEPFAFDRIAPQL